MTTCEELESILTKHSFGELSSPAIERLTDGWTNLTLKFYIGSNAKPYILREYLRSGNRISVLAEIDIELKLISYLFQDYRLPVVPMLDPPGIFELNNGHYGVIFPFVDGVKYVNSPKMALRQLWQTVEISQFLGKMHAIQQPDFGALFNRRTLNIANIKYQLVKSCDTFARDYPDLYKRIQSILDEHIHEIPLIQNEHEQLLFEQDLERNLPKGFVHADVHDDNVLFHMNQPKIAAVLDFDDMLFGPFLIDIAMTLCFWCSCGPIFNFDYAKEFLIHYQHSRNMPLTVDEWKLLELYCYMMMFHQILFIIQSDDSRMSVREMIDELLLPIEQISQNRMFLKEIQ